MAAGRHDLLEIQSASPFPGPEANCPPSQGILHHQSLPLWAQCAFVVPEQTQLVQGAGVRQLFPRPGAASSLLPMPRYWAPLLRETLPSTWLNLVLFLSHSQSSEQGSGYLVLPQYLANDRNISICRMHDITLITLSQWPFLIRSSS